MIPTIATWNLHPGATTDVVLERAPAAEVLLLQMCRDSGHCSAWEHDQGGAWGSGVVLREGRLVPMELPWSHGHVLGGEVVDAPWTSGRRVFVFSIHAPPAGYDPDLKGHPVDLHTILEVLVERTPKRAELVVGGDFDLGTLGEPVPGAPVLLGTRWMRHPWGQGHSVGLFVPRTWLPGVRVESGEEVWISERSEHTALLAQVPAARQVELKLVFQRGGDMFAWLWWRALPSDRPRVSWPQQSLRGGAREDFGYLARAAQETLEASGERIHLVVDGFVWHPVDTTPRAIRLAVRSVVAHLRGERLPDRIEVWDPARPFKGEGVPLREVEE